MLDKASALRIILGEAPATRSVDEVPMGLAFGRVLARDAVADVDMPPFEKSSMDGWAVRAADVAKVPAALVVRGAIHAGQTPPAPLTAGETWKIMTGAPLPPGADAVVMVEDSTLSADGRTVELRRSVNPWQNVCRLGEDVRRGDVVVRAGVELDAAALSLLASVGVDPVPTYRPPTVCVIPTGDELVPPMGPAPGPGQIRESNGILLDLQVRQVSSALRVFRPGIARDTRESLREFLDVGLGHDVLILSGGVSMGDLDLVGVELKARGLQVKVEKVSIKPGKPLLFGTVSRGDGSRCTVFGLPGNPVSSFVTFELFVRPYLLACLGRSDVEAERLWATLDHDREIKVIARTQHVPAVVVAGEGGLSVKPLVWHGSADLRGVVDANGLIVVESSGPAPRPGDRVLVERLANRALRPRRLVSREP